MKHRNALQLSSWLGTLIAVITTGAGRTAEAASCSFDAQSAQISVSLNAGESGSLSVSSANRILLNNVSCGAATINNTDQINVTGAGGNETFSLTSPCKAYRPGLTPEASGSSDIEILIDLGAGADTLVLVGAADSDSITLGTSGINCNADDDADIGSAGIETFKVSGASGNDVLSAAGDVVTGASLAAKVIFYGQDGDDSLIGAAQNDYLNGGAGIDSLSGGAGADTLIGGPGSDIEQGGDGDDIFDQDATTNGGDVMRGGAGNDRVSYARRTIGVMLTMNSDADDGEPNEGDDVGSDIEQANGGAGDDVIVGSASANVIWAGPGDDQIDGGDGNDTLSGEAGHDHIRGGAGNDTMTGGDGDDMLYAEANMDGADQFRGSAGYDIADYSARSLNLRITIDATANDGETNEKDRVQVDVEGVLAGSGNDYISGTDADNYLDGGAGDDTIIGLAGYNQLSGGDGNDRLFGGDNWDDIFGGEGDDYLSGGGDDDDLEGEGGNDRIDGGDGWDFIAGGEGADELDGGDGSDWIEGEDGDDVMIGGNGDDTLWGADGDDQVSCGADYDIVITPDWADDCEESQD